MKGATCSGSWVSLFFPDSPLVHSLIMFTFLQFEELCQQSSPVWQEVGECNGSFLASSVSPCSIAGS